MTAPYTRRAPVSGAMRTAGIAFALMMGSCGAGGPPPLVKGTPEPADPTPAFERATSGLVSATTSARSTAVAASTLSVGTTSTGHLERGVELPLEGEHHSIIDRLRKFGARWGTAEMVMLIQHAAAYVHEHEGGAPLRVAELSLPGGGDIRAHKSHNSGRDVDFAFYVLDADGNSVPAPKQIRFNKRGKSGTGLQFDVARNWRFVEGLLTQEIAPVQWLFVSNGLRGLLLEHARKTGADPEVIQRAELVLKQPSAASPHANHFHMRIACAPDDIAGGCVDTGPQWAWVTGETVAEL